MIAVTAKKPTPFAEAWLLRRLEQPALFDGVTTSTDRRERLREYLLSHGMELAIAGSQNGKCETWSQLFQSIYGVSLHDPRPINRNTHEEVS